METIVVPDDQGDLAMCRGSVNALKTEDAQEGLNYEISMSSHLGGSNMHGVLHRPKMGVHRTSELSRRERIIACAACIRGRRRVELSIPISVAVRLGLSEAQSAVFISGDDEADQQDKIELPNGRKIDLYDLADQDIVLRLTTTEAQAPIDTHGMAPFERELEDA